MLSISMMAGFYNVAPIWLFYNFGYLIDPSGEYRRWILRGLLTLDCGKYNFHEERHFRTKLRASVLYGYVYYSLKKAKYML